MYNQISIELGLIIKEQFPEDEVCLLLSGGSDSTVVGLVADELGKKIHSISFHLEGQTSWDFQTAKSTSETLGWIFHEVKVPTLHPKNDFLNLVQNYGCKKKTELEVLFPFLCLIEKVKELGFTKVLTGFSSPLPDGRKDSIKIKENNSQYWEKTLNIEYDSTATKMCVEYASKQNIQISQPLNDPSIKDILVGKTWSDIHKPYWKSPWKLLYKDTFEKLGLLSLGKTPGLQVGGGIEGYFASVINDPEINFKGYISGNITLKLSQLTRLWSEIDHSQKVTPYSIRHNFEPYTCSGQVILATGL